MGRLMPAPSSALMSAAARSQEPACSRINCVQESMRKSYGQAVYESLQKLRYHSFVVTDPHLPEHPIVYASDAFLHMTGYHAEDVLGRNPRFLQGPDTDNRSVLQVRDAISEQRACHTVLLCYTKQGWPFRVAFHMAPVFSETNGTLLHFVSEHKPLPDFLCPQISLSEPASVGFLKGPSVLLKNTIEAENFNFWRQLSDGPLFYHCSGQQKETTMTASNVLGLVIHDLVLSNKLMNSKALQGTCLSGITEFGLCSSLCLALARIHQSFVICNSNFAGMPVVYASDMFLQLTGYEKDEVMGRSCKFLQGQDTDTRAVDQIGDATRKEIFCTVRILNYRKDGSPFWNLLHISPVRDHTGKVVYYVGVQLFLAFPPEVESCHAQSETSPSISQLGAVGAVKVAVRSLQSNGLCRTPLRNEIG